MREVDRRTIEAGIPGIVLMENAGHRVVEFLVEKFAPLENQRIVVLCGKGNNGGDGLVIARQLFTRFEPEWLHVVIVGDPGEMKGEAAENVQMLRTAGCPIEFEITSEMHVATVVVDALLGTGLRGPAEGRMAEIIREINDGFPLADIVAVDLPSGMQSDTGRLEGDIVSANYTVTFTAPKVCQVLSPAAEHCGRLRVAPIGTPPDMFESDDSVQLSLVQPDMFRQLFEPREAESNKGRYGHVLVIAGGRGKTGAAAMTGIAALKAGAGLTTVASAGTAIEAISSYAPELMTVPLPETDSGSISARALDQGLVASIAEKKTVVAVGPGLGTHPDTVRFVHRLVEELHLPMVVDADGLNAIAGKDLRGPAPRILTPHPGEMGRLAMKTVEEVQADRVETARAFARERGVCLVLKGHRTVIAFADGRVFVNPTNSPALATGGTGDVLTGLIAGLLAQFPDQLEATVLAAVYLHGRAGELGAAAIGEKSFMATDVLVYLPEAMREVAEGRNLTLG
jgi:ADP-dependent NAD(P)H-hydrate dehydratase / NAD(P)H-hydrate epimerase